jgi:ADP-ribose pyrophosphatase
MAPEDLADRPAKVTITATERLAKGYRPYDRYHLTLHEAGGAAIEQQRDVVLGGKVIAVLPLDVARQEIVLLRQFRLPAHLADGRGELVEIVAGRVDAGETPLEAARRECEEEIGIKPANLIPILTYLTTPGLTDEEVTLYVAAVDASSVIAGPHTTIDGERLHIFRAPFDAALAALDAGTLRGSPVVIGLQWLALNRARLSTLLSSAR